MADQPIRVDMSNPEGALIRKAIEDDQPFEMYDPDRPDVAPIVVDHFLLRLMRPTED